MTDTQALRSLVNAKGLKYKYIACQMGLSAYGLMKKIENKAEFKVSEVDKLSKLLELTAKQKEKIFCAVEVELKSTNNNDTDQVS